MSSYDRPLSSRAQGRNAIRHHARTNIRIMKDTDASKGNIQNSHEFVNAKRLQMHQQPQRRIARPSTEKFLSTFSSASATLPQHHLPPFSFPSDSPRCQNSHSSTSAA